MAISVIRKLTDEDSERIEAAAQRFVRNHPELGIELDVWQNAAEAVEFTLSGAEDNGYPVTPDHARYLARLWLACWRRAVQHPTANASEYGYIGWRVN